MTTVETQHEHADMNVEHAHHDHPSDLFYVKVFAVLVVLTGIEVALSYNEIGGAHGTIGLLLIFAAAKFVIVVSYFMHLKFDHPWFRRLFITGFVLATFCYLAYLSTLHVFHR
ncbi:MAG: cytochrome c oxidase subunit [Actinomycetota bacterium]|jgi:cytochrome c oxidase subunit 4